ncbi:beta-glucosidase 22-like [Musa acuminata AAA Group]|uniref:beta-glucosidase 22-like n=1 Tax=Musa acuminata AAA Group TaxID=214697 RepID=UPI0031DD2386
MREGNWACLLILLLLLCLEQVLGVGQLMESSFSRDAFPPDFIFGAGTSAYQVEGAAAEDGRSPSLWDTFTHTGQMIDKSTGDVACDGYHKYKEDVKLMADTGLDSYRFSISWSRLIPNGRGAVNLKGLQFYNNFINELVKYGIEPHVTLYHLDLPQVLEDEYVGWLSPKIVDDFTAYANVCFTEFGDRIPRWTTIVEPNVIGMASYDSAIFPPARCSNPFGVINCTVGNSTIEPYIAVHNLLLAHASVVKLYRTKYQGVQKGQIGLNLYAYWCYPWTDSAADIEATQRTLDFNVGWILNPLVFGDYPEVMKKIVGSRLPSFTKYESKQLKDSFDYIGLNYYTSVYVKDNFNASMTGPRDFNTDVSVLLARSRNETPGGQFDPTIPALIDPIGLQLLLEYFKDAYGNPPIFVEENGNGVARKESEFNDTSKIDFLSGHISSILDAIRNGANVKGYFVWSFMDVFEFITGYQSRYGLYFVNFDDENRERKPKLSAQWYSSFLKQKKKKKKKKVEMRINKTDLVISL